MTTREITDDLFLYHLKRAVRSSGYDYPKNNESLSDIGMDSLAFLEALLSLEESLMCEIPDEGFPVDIAQAFKLPMDEFLTHLKQHLKTNNILEVQKCQELEKNNT